MKKFNKKLIKKAQSLLRYFPFVKSRMGIFLIVIAVYFAGVGVFALQPSQQSVQNTPVNKQTTTAQHVTTPSQQQPVKSPTTSTATSNKSNVNSQVSDFRPFECKDIAIARQTEYRNDDSMAIGETKLISQGTDGYIVSCTADSNGYLPPTNGMRVDPVNDVVSTGTGLDALRQQQADEALTERNQRYNLAVSQCVHNLTIRGVQSDTAQSACRSSVQY